MPLPISIAKKKVILNEDTKDILQILDESLDKQELTQKSETERKRESELSSSEAIDEKGWWIYLVINPLEKAKGKAYGAKSRTLPLIKVKLDHPAVLLKNAYVDYLNDLLVQMLGNDCSKKTEEKTITSRFVLVREILIRLAIVALCTDMNAERDGDKILDALKDFIKSVNETDILKDKKILGKKLSSFNIDFGVDHDKWLLCLRNIVTVIKNLHANTTALTGALEYLDLVKRTTMRQLIAELDSGKQFAALSDNWIRSTLISCEKLVIESKKPIKNSYASMQISMKNSMPLATRNSSDELERQKQVIKRIEEKSTSILDPNTSKQLKIKQLYQFLNKTNLLIRVVSQVDLLTTIAGWVPLMTGALKIKVLSDLINSHDTESSKVLAISNKSPVFNEKVGDALIKYESASSSSLTSVASEVSNSLSKLQQPHLIRQLIEYMSGSLCELVNLQSSLGCELIDLEICESMGVLSNARPAVMGNPSHRLELKQEERNTTLYLTSTNDADNNNEGLQFESTEISLNSLYDQAQDLYRSKSYQKAIGKLAQFLYQEKQVEEVVKALMLRALAYNRSGDKEKALIDLDKARNLDPKNINILYMRAKLLFKKRNYKEALQDVDSLLNLDPDNQEAQVLRDNILHLISLNIPQEQISSIHQNRV